MPNYIYSTATATFVISGEVQARGVPSGKKIVARSFHRVTQQISRAWIDRFFKIWVHMKALILLFHCRYDS